MPFTGTVALDALELASTMTGEVIAPQDEQYDIARRAWNLAVDQRPALVAFPESAADVAAVVGYARSTGLTVAPQGTGHNAAPLASLDRTILLSTQRMRGVEIDAEARTARVAAGTLWLEVTSLASEHGLAPLAGSSPDVGVIGYTLGGGLSWLGRKHGLAANSVTAVELVTGEGELIRATPEEHADVFWAIRGGGGNFGVVTALEFRLYEVEALTAGFMFWPQDRAAEVVHAWHEWTKTVPDEVTTAIRLLNLPPMPELPEFLRGRSIVIIDGAVLAEAGEAAELLAPLRALGPEMDTFAEVPPVALSRIHMDPEQPMPGIGDGVVLDGLDAETVDAWIAATGPESGTALLMSELRHVGGALGREPQGAGAIGRIRGEYLTYSLGVPMVPELVEGIHASLARVADVMAPRYGGRYMNFSETAVDPVEFHGFERVYRMREIRDSVDPSRVMLSNHRI